MKTIGFAFAMMIVLASNVFAQSPAQPEVVNFPVVDGKYQDVTVVVPGLGHDETINVPIPVVTVHKVSRLSIRGGFSLGSVFAGRAEPTIMGGLVGEIGYTASPWRLQGRFNGGVFHKDLALSGGVAVMRRLGRSLRAGLGADILAHMDLMSHPGEGAAERFVGGSARFAYSTNSVLLEWSVGLAFQTHQVPGYRETDDMPIIVGGASASYMFGK